MAGITLLVCITCRRTLPSGETQIATDDLRPGAELLRTLANSPIPEGVTLRGVECLSACANGCAVALTGPGRWSYVYGNLDPEQHTPAILEGVAAYAATADGLVPWRQRPEIFRKQSIARIPPQD